MVRNSEDARSGERRQKHALPGPKVESDRCAFRNIMPASQRPCNGCASMWIVQCDVMASIDTQWFTDRLAERRMSQRQLAKLMGIDSSAVSLIAERRAGLGLAGALDQDQRLITPRHSRESHATI